MRPVFAALLALLLPLASIAQEKSGEKKKDPSDEVFKPAGAVPRFKITVDPDALKVLKKEPRKYVRCTVRVGDAQFEDVGIHLKGAAGSYRDWDDRPALTLNFDKFKSGQRWQGLDKIHLNNSAQDGSVMHEILGSEMYRAIGVPTARAAHAIVELNGRKMGLYGLKEGYNGNWIERNFPKADKGNLYDGGFLQDIDAPLELDTGKDVKRKDLEALVKACRDGDHNKRYAAVEKVVDADLFTKMAVVQALTCDWDGYPRNRNNYRVYFRPTDGKAVFIPHGMDQLWQNPGEGIWPGWGGMVAQTLLDHPEGRKKGIATYKEVVEKQFVLETLNKRIDEWGNRAKEALAAIDKNQAKNYENELKGLKERLKQRADLLKRELPKLK
ncbi:MAG: CotH kinase family protein [Fimbriiglobus sp.]|jgi:spore coat protein CotH|nr:CotH kinase family protein [Fimbriiglobus sp.]